MPGSHKARDNRALLTKGTCPALSIPGLADYYNLVLDSPTNPFQMSSNVTTAGNLTVASGTLTILPDTATPAAPYVLTVGTNSGDLVLGATGSPNTNGTLIATNGSIEAFKEKQPVAREAFINTGTYCFNRHVFSLVVPLS